MTTEPQTQSTQPEQHKPEAKYAVGRNPYPEDSDSHDKVEVISFEELEEKFQKLEGFKDSGINSVYRSDQKKALNKLRDIGFKPMAWTPNVRYLFYNPNEEILIKDVEGDLFIYENPTQETLEEEIQNYPKAEVSIGEKYDSRFNRGEQK